MHFPSLQSSLGYARRFSRAFLVSLATISPLLSLADEPSPIFLRASASGANDGSSWENAFVNVHDAINAASSGRPVYVAEGFYKLNAPIVVSTPLTIYGGFAGLSTDETPETRSTSDHVTIFSGDTNDDDIWAHAEPSNYSKTETKLTDCPIVSNGILQLPPAFTGEYDVYYPENCSDNVKGAILLNKVAATIDGLTFIGFNPSNSNDPSSANPNLTAVICTLDNSQTTINDCAFIGNNTAYGAAFLRNNQLISNSRILFSKNNYRCAGVTSRASSPVISNCTFSSLYRPTMMGSGNVFHSWATSIIVKDCSVDRSLFVGESNYSSLYGGPGNIFSNEGGTITMSGTIISNCLTSSTFTYGIPFFSSGRSGNHLLSRCAFINNRTIVKPVADRSYSMFSNSCESGSPLCFDSCTFANNTVEAPEVAATSGSYTLSIVGNAPGDSTARKCDSYLVNCTFDSNTISATPTPNVSPIFCRGVMTQAFSWNNSYQTGLANCTFTGPALESVYDVAQIGIRHTQPLNIVNCIFLADGETIHNPIFSDTPHLMKIYTSTIQNHFTPNADITYSSLATDKIPLQRVNSSSGIYALQPIANPPLLHTTCDVATNHLQAPFSYAFREPGSTTWIALTPLIKAIQGSVNKSKTTIGDALGNPRSEGSFTRGAVQPLSDVAENGSTLVLRRMPFAAGAFSAATSADEPYNTPVPVQATENAIIPITAASSDPALYAFNGWYNEDDSLYSSSPMLSIDELTDSPLVLTAKFSAPTVALTFSLGQYGTFNLPGNPSSFTTNVTAQTPFPSLPEIIPNDGWILNFANLPDFAPTTDSYYTANYFSADLRIIYVVPESEAPAIQDGTSWATAYTNITTAIEDAGQYRGEVRIKTGRYLLLSPIDLRSNVAIRGGFAGTESAEDEPNPEAYPTIITGDVLNNDYWVNNSNVGSLASTPIWLADGSYNPPNPTGIDLSWRPHGGNSEDTSIAFRAINLPAINVILEALTLTCFKDSPLYLDGDCKDMVVKSCKFLACRTNRDSSFVSAVNINNTAPLFTDCLFDGNNRSVFITTTKQIEPSFVNCTFSNNYANNRGAGIRIEGSSGLSLSNCTFYRNYCDAHGTQGSAAVSIYGTGTCTFEDVEFLENRPHNSCHGTVYISSGTSIFERCRFLKNVNKNANHINEDSNSAAIGIGGATVEVRNCIFAENEVISGTNSDRHNASAICQNAGTANIFNCTFVSNSVTVNVTTAKNPGRFATVNHMRGKMAIVNCLFSENKLQGNAPTATADLRDGSSSEHLGVINTVFANSNPDYLPLVFDNSAIPAFANCLIDNMNKVVVPELTPSNKGYMKSITTDSVVLSPVLTGENGAQAIRPLGRLCYALGQPVWFYNNAVYFRDASLSQATPYRELGNRNTALASPFLADTTPIIPDAFDAQRNPRHVSLGPLNLPSAATLLQLQ